MSSNSSRSNRSSHSAPSSSRSNPPPPPTEVDVCSLLSAPLARSRRSSLSAQSSFSEGLTTSSFHRAMYAPSSPSQSSVCASASTPTSSCAAPLNRTVALTRLLSDTRFAKMRAALPKPPPRTAEHEEPAEYKDKPTNKILEPELSLQRLGYSPTNTIREVAGGASFQNKKKSIVPAILDRIRRKVHPDCAVVIGTEEIECHMLVLQAHSQLMEESSSMSTKIGIPTNRCSVPTFQFIYEWMCGNDEVFHELSVENVLDILIASRFLKIAELTDQLWYLFTNEKVFIEHDAFYLYIDAKKKDVQLVPEMMVGRVKHFFLTLVSSEDWLLLPLEDVCTFLCSNEVVISTELEIFMAAVRWLQHDWTSRSEFKVQVMECVRFGNVEPCELIQLMYNSRSCEFTIITDDPVVNKLVKDGIAYSMSKGEGEECEEWQARLRVVKPIPRTWKADDVKHYNTYREFLIVLDQLRREVLVTMEKHEEPEDPFIF